MASVPSPAEGNVIVTKALLETLVAKKEFRHIITTVPGVFQMGTMWLDPNTNIGLEHHDKAVQTFEVIWGNGRVTLGTADKDFSVGDFVTVPPGFMHDVTAGPHGIFLRTTYSPPQHPHNTIHTTRLEGTLEDQVVDTVEGLVSGGIDQVKKRALVERESWGYQIYPFIFYDIKDNQAKYKATVALLPRINKALATFGYRVHSVDINKNRFDVHKPDAPEKWSAPTRIWMDGAWRAEIA